jgi:DNA-binding NarL/FixJ family response regulator
VVPPDAPPGELAAAVGAVARGLVVLPKAMAGRVIGEPAAVGVAEPAVEDPLTAREHQILGLLAEGLPNKRIARELGISEHTVKFHVSSVFAKLGVQSRAEAVSVGARRGLISL